MNCNTARDRETYRFYQAAINALELRIVEDSPGCTVPPSGFIPRACKDTALTAFAQLGALRLDVNRGLISLLDGRYQYILAEATRTLSLLPNIDPDPEDDLWLGSVIIPRSKGVCEHVLSLGDMVQEPTTAGSNVPAVIINDLAKDPRFWDRGYVRSEPGVRFYAGVPLRSPWGTIIGAYCVFGHEPRNGLTQEQLLALQGLATTVMAYLETSKAKEGHRRYEQMLHGLTSFVTGEPSIHSLDEQQHNPPEPATTLPQTANYDRVVSTAERGPQDAVPLEAQWPSSPTERNSSPKNKKRPRILSTAGPTARKRSTMSLQECMLPTGSKKMFSRAANIMRESIDLCGCVIYDASVTTFGGAINTPHRRSSVESQSGNPSASSSETSSSHGGGNNHSPPGQPWTVDSKSSGSEGDHLADRKMCEILGFSLKETASISGDDRDMYCAELAESDLKRLLRRYPFGHIFNVTSAGDFSPSSAPDSHPEMAPSSEAVDCHGNRANTKRTASTDKHGSMIQKLLKVAPGARSMAILPLWDYQRERWFAGCLCWTTEPNRVLYPDVDLIYLQAFGNSIMTELSRLDAITSDRAKTTFVASISHELRCPLHGILGGIQFLQDTPLDAYQASMLDSVAMCGRTLLDTIDHVLDFAKVNTFTKSAKISSKRKQDPTDLIGEKGNQGLSEPTSLEADVDLAALTEEVVEAVFAGQIHRGVLSRIEQNSGLTTAPLKSTQRAFPIAMNQPTEILNNGNKNGDKIVRIILDIPHQVGWTVTTQPGAWRRVVMNLVGNAIKYTKSGYIRVSLRTKLAERSTRQDSAATEITLIVSDSGKGISTEYLRGGLWRPFSQEDSFSPGTGLGLSIVRQIVHGLNGKVDLKSEVQVGTEVKVALSMPVAKDHLAPDDEDRFLPLANTQLKDRAICILEATTPEGLETPILSIAKGRHDFGLSLTKTLKQWFGADAVVSNVLTALSAEVIICIEPHIEFLTTMRGMTSPEKRPLVVFIALDGSEAASLRSDPRLDAGDIVVDIITQPCGPRKLAKILSQALDRRDKQMPLTVTPLASPLRGTPEADSPTREWKSPNWIPTHLGDSQSESSNSRADSTKDTDTIPRTLVNKYVTSTSMQHPPTEHHLRILLVDDNRINLSLLTAFMRRYNFEYEEAMNGLQAVETYKQAHGSFDYVLMDLTMPVMDGMAATREIRRYEQREGVRPTVVIALTGLASAAARIEALNSGINFFLTKPVKFQALHQMLRGVAGGASAVTAEEHGGGGGRA